MKKKMHFNNKKSKYCKKILYLSSVMYEFICIFDQQKILINYVQRTTMKKKKITLMLQIPSPCNNE